MALPQRLQREYATIQYMLEIYCKDHHQYPDRSLCGECRELLGYAAQRLERCPYKEQKPTCAKCPIHCYKEDMRVKVQAVMRYSGPKMIFNRPLLSILHLLDGLKQPLRPFRSESISTAQEAEGSNSEDNSNQ